MRKTIAASAITLVASAIALVALVLVALSGCASTESQEGPAPAPSTSQEASQPLGDLLLPPTPTTTLEPIQGLLPPSTQWQPAPAPWQVDLPEVEDLPVLPE